MSTAELTSKIESLSVDDYNIVIMLIDRLAAKSDRFASKSADDIVDELTMSMKSSDEGNTKLARRVSEKMKEKYAV